MARCESFICRICTKSKYEIVSSPFGEHTCIECKARLDKEVFTVWAESRKDLSLEKRIELLEEFMYHHQKKDHSYTPPVYK